MISKSQKLAISLPNGAGTFPGVILITGSGPQGRNDSSCGVKFNVGLDTLGSRILV